jgi:hypothetical protein
VVLVALSVPMVIGCAADRSYGPGRAYPYGGAYVYDDDYYGYPYWGWHRHPYWSRDWDDWHDDDGGRHRHRDRDNDMARDSDDGGDMDRDQARERNDREIVRERPDRAAPRSDQPGIIFIPEQRDSRR